MDVIPVYLHIGENEIVATDNIIGIFSLDMMSRCKQNRVIEKQARRESRWFKISRNPDRAVVLTTRNEYILSPISVATLRRRLTDITANFSGMEDEE